MTLLSILSIGLISTADAKKPKAEPVNPMPMQNFYLRDTPDKDPTVFMGRFIFDDEFPNESKARKTECSQYLSITTVDAGNVEYDEVLNGSAALSAK